MDAHDFERVRAAFVAAAQRALRIGFDAIELHMAHGYLLHSFASPISNRRQDRYGGSHDNRFRFPFEVAEAVRAVVPRGVPLGARMTGNDWDDAGLNLDDAVAFARGLQERGLDFVDISSGGVRADIRNPATAGYNVPLAERIKREVPIKVRTVGLITTPEQAEDIVASGKADMVALGRTFLDQPHWGWAAARTLGADVRYPPQYLRASAKLWQPQQATR
jgi:2,4-dienoyl-CoA reductase-like NADH-dependent reductase (Old Yellow Enzyme family)